jgi:hypothetical protein
MGLKQIGKNIAGQKNTRTLIGTKKRLKAFIRLGQ